MRRTAMNIKGELHAGVDRALMNGGILGLSVLAFMAVIREGIETALFLMGQATAAGRGGVEHARRRARRPGASPSSSATASTCGARVLNLRTFFLWTGVALIFIAAGLLAHAVHEFVEIGWITIGTGTAFDISAILPHEAADGGLGRRGLDPAGDVRLHEHPGVDHPRRVAGLRGRRAVPLHCGPSDGATRRSRARSRSRVGA